MGLIIADDNIRDGWGLVGARCPCCNQDARSTSRKFESIEVMMRIGWHDNGGAGELVDDDSRRTSASGHRIAMFV
jgi:hypothetical protein